MNKKSKSVNKNDINKTENSISNEITEANNVKIENNKTNNEVNNNEESKKKDFLHYFYDLSSSSSSKRLAAHNDIIETLQNNVKKEEDIHYTLNRLISGLTSSHDAARQGFSTTLISLLNTFEEYTPLDKVFQLIEEKTQIIKSMKGPEFRGLMFGRLFGYLAIIRSNRLLKEINKDEISYNMIEKIIEMGQKKEWFREICYESILYVLTNVSNDLFTSKIVLLIQSILPLNIEKYNSEEVMLVAGLQLFIKSRNLTNDCQHFIATNFINLNTIKLLKSPFSFCGKTYPRIHTVWYYLLRNIMETNFKHRIDTISFVNIDLLKEIQYHLIETMFLKGTKERRGIGFKLINLLSNILPYEYIHIILSPIIIRSIYIHSNNGKSILHSLAKNCLITLETNINSNNLYFLKTLMKLFISPDSLFKCKDTLEDNNNNNNNMDANSELYQDHDFIQQWILNRLHQILINLIHYKNKNDIKNDNTIATQTDNENENKIDNNKKENEANNETKIKNKIISFLLLFGCFKTNSNNYSELIHYIDNIHLSDKIDKKQNKKEFHLSNKIRNSTVNKLFICTGLMNKSLLGLKKDKLKNFINNDIGYTSLLLFEQYLNNKSLILVNDTLNESNNLIVETLKKMIQYIKNISTKIDKLLIKISKHDKIQNSEINNEVNLKKDDDILNVIIMKRNNNKNLLFQLQAFSALFVNLFYQLFINEYNDNNTINDIHDMINDLFTCYDKIVLSHSNVSNDKIVLNDTSMKDKDNNENNNPISVLVDLLISFLSKESKPLRDLVTIVFTSIRYVVPKETLENIIDIITNDQNNELINEQNDDDEFQPIDTIPEEDSENDSDLSSENDNKNDNANDIENDSENDNANENNEKTDNDKKIIKNTNQTTVEPEAEKEILIENYESLNKIMKNDNDYDSDMYINTNENDERMIESIIKEIKNKDDKKMNAKKLLLNITNFHLRVIDLLKIFVNHSSFDDKCSVSFIIIPLIKYLNKYKNVNNNSIKNERIINIINKHFITKQVAAVICKSISNNNVNINELYNIINILIEFVLQSKGFNTGLLIDLLLFFLRILMSKSMEGICKDKYNKLNDIFIKNTNNHVFTCKKKYKILILLYNKITVTLPNIAWNILPNFLIHIILNNDNNKNKINNNDKDNHSNNDKANTDNKDTIKELNNINEYLQYEGIRLLIVLFKNKQKDSTDILKIVNNNDIQMFIINKLSTITSSKLNPFEILLIEFMYPFINESLIIQSISEDNLLLILKYLNHIMNNINALGYKKKINNIIHLIQKKINKRKLNNDKIMIDNSINNKKIKLNQETNNNSDSNTIMTTDTNDHMNTDIEKIKRKTRKNKKKSSNKSDVNNVTDLNIKE